MTAQNPIRHFITKLRSHCELSQAETEALLSIPFHLRECGETPTSSGKATGRRNAASSWKASCAGSRW